MFPIIPVILLWLPFLINSEGLKAQLTEDEKNTIEVVKKTQNSVVFITNIQLVRDFFSWTEEAVPRGSGSGFVWDDQGHIITNYHVIEEGDRFNVTLPNQEERSAKLIGKEPNRDIAVLKVEGSLKGLYPVKIGSSSNLLVGQKVIAIGNPFGFDHTVTTGIVSALGRSMPGVGGVTIRDMIQTDASINPGNSGGPLLNSSGELIGMNTMIISPSGASSGVGFAIPVDIIKKIVPQLIKYGRVIRPGLGLSLLSDRYGQQLGIDGVAIVEVPVGSEAYKKGLRGLTRSRFGRLAIQDIIKEIDGKKVHSYDDLYNLLDNYNIGDKVTLTVERDNRKRKVELTLVQED
ncbi:MAG TPA: trypsin-like serine protease [Candidatus Aminicenantes bacterium]|nr:MAG: 2-alkenal reductase [Candidatus Aminicenantes bacterium]HEK86343.1 trypsin-like serine protease [Candidatus Aminicenantes bacterium]